MKKSFYLSAAVLGLLLTTAFVSATSFAAASPSSLPADEQDVVRHFGPRQEMRDVIETNDFDGWKALMTEQVTTVRQHADELEKSITPEHFATMVEVHQLIEDGQYDQAKVLMEESGIKTFTKALHGPGPGHRMMFTHRTATQQ